MDYVSPWLIEPFGDRGDVRAIHTSGLRLLVSRSGWATVTERPSEVSEIEATVLMAELQRWLTEDAQKGDAIF